MINRKSQAWGIIALAGMGIAISICLATVGIKPAASDESVQGTTSQSSPVEQARLRSKIIRGRWRPKKLDGDQVLTYRPDGTGTNIDGSRFSWYFEGRHLVARREGDTKDGEALLSIRFTQDANAYELSLQNGTMQSVFERVGEDGKPLGHKQKSGGEFAVEPIVVPPLPGATEKERPIGRLVVHVDAKEAPELQEWADESAELLPQWYPKIVEALGSPETPPLLEINLVVKGDDRPPGETRGKTIMIASKWIKDYPEEKGIVGHELVHVLQRYGSGAPAWLVEGIPDYIRYFVVKNESSPRLLIRDSDYTHGYWPAAHMLDWLERTKGPGVVARLHRSLQEGTYSEAVFEKLAGCKPKEAWQQFAADFEKRDPSPKAE